jgi:hypothetical protein
MSAPGVLALGSARVRCDVMETLESFWHELMSEAVS